MKEIEYALLFHPDLIKEEVGVGFLHLEEPKRKLAQGLMSIHNNKPYHFPDVERTAEELMQAYDEVINTRSEEHTSELQSLMRISYAVFCLKKKNTMI